ncbi:MAG: alpha/beta fold hydrolase [Erysipelotrichaceae bacterium]|nr:alpha/beta fold hydrolase [Erysipelotrichaceae bacterium]
MKIEEFHYRSSSDICDIYAIRYIPEGQIRAILQISHGMQEYIGRYDGFMRYLADHGILVTGNDHLGHGYSIKDKSYYGYFAPKDGDVYVLKDIHELTRLTKEKYPNIPYFLLGHSMGSFFARRYLFTYGGELSGAIIMGTGHQGKGLVSMGKMMAKILAKQKGDFYRSKTLTATAFGSYNKRFEGRTSVDWLTKDTAIVDKYLNDERDNYLFTCNGFVGMFSCIETLYSKSNLNRMPKDLPVLFVSGEEDPVGDYGKGVQKAAETFRDAGMKDVEVKLYPGDRHEILNELDKEKVYQDLENWITKKTA